MDKNLKIYASYWVWSNVIKVTVGYTLNLTYTVNNGNVTLIAKLTDLNGNPKNNATIHFYSCADYSGSNRNLLGTSNTNSSGIATYTYVFPSNGTYYFQAGYQVP